MLLGIQTSPREIIQCLVLLRAHQIVNEKTLTLNKGSEEKYKKQRGSKAGREGGGFNSSSQGKRNNREMFCASLSTKL